MNGPSMDASSPTRADAAPSLPILGPLLEAHFAQSALELPLLPTYATQVVALCSDPASDARSLASLLQRDPSLAAHVLSIANSAALGAREPIVSLQQAIARLGVRALANVALSVAVKTKVFHSTRQVERVQALWKHSARTAAWSREIARARRRNVETAFLCGLLHEVGAPIVLDAIDALQTRCKLNFSAQDIEDQLHVQHPQVGARLIETWKLPASVAAAAAHHHEPSIESEFHDEVATTALADQLADVPADQAIEPANFEALLALLGMYEEDLAELIERRAAIEAMGEGLA